MLIRYKGSIINTDKLKHVSISGNNIIFRFDSKEDDISHAHTNVQEAVAELDKITALFGIQPTVFPPANNFQFNGNYPMKF